MSGEGIVLLGAFPPPLGGASKNNQLLYEELLGMGRQVRIINTSGPKIAHSRGIRYHFHRLTVNVIAIISLIKGGRILYAVPDGGLGVWYTLAQMLFANMFFDKIILHHRTFQYIDYKNIAMSLIVRMLYSKATHVFLSPIMKSKFESIYGSVEFLISTNARYVSGQVNRPIGDISHARMKIGHLSNLCREKGFFDVADTFERVVKLGLDCELHVAGPEIEPSVTKRIGDLKLAHPERVFSYGPLSGAAKDEFYAALDVFLFPTRFAQEAAPNVVYEAMAAGNYVIVNDRGCIRDMVSDVQGLVTQEDTFVETAADRLLKFKVTEIEAARMKESIREKVRVDVASSQEEYRFLMDCLLNDGHPHG